MPTTKNLGLVNVLEGENFDIDVYNGNNDKVDAFAGTVPKKKTLFSNANGTSNTIALNDSAANYDYVLISWVDNDGFYHADTPCINGKKAQLSTVYVRPTVPAYAKSAVVNVSGTSISFESNFQMQLPPGEINSNVIPVKITKVVGVKGF